MTSLVTAFSEWRQYGETNSFLDTYEDDIEQPKLHAITHIHPVVRQDFSSSFFRNLIKVVIFTAYQSTYEISLVTTFYSSEDNTEKQKGFLDTYEDDIEQPTVYCSLLSPQINYSYFCFDC